jgi:tyrosinase
MTGILASDLFRFLQNNNINLPMRGIDQEMSLYDLFVFWHVVAMSIPISPGNAAHSAPVFLPWHRMYMIRLEQELQRVLGNIDFGLPYWDWAMDGEIQPSMNQWQTNLWGSAALGEARGQVRSGPIADIKVRLFQNGGTLWSINERALERQAGQGVATLPIQADVTQSLSESEYDTSPWGTSASGLRNRLEGWINGPQLHNRVHVWVGGDMSPGTSPNDPVFFLNHCNADRIWEAWMADHGRDYRPGNNEGPSGHRLNDIMVAILGNPQTPADVLDPQPWYSYDSLMVN